MTVSIESVTEVATFLRAASGKDVKQGMRERLLDYAGIIDAVADEVLDLRGKTKALPPDLGNVYDLPSELLEELSIAKGDELDDQLVTVINAYGGEASLDQILVGLYRKFKVTQKRRFIQNKLYRMEMIWSVEGRKGVYTTQKSNSDGVDFQASEELSSDSAIRGTRSNDEDEDSGMPF